MNKRFASMTIITLEIIEKKVKKSLKMILKNVKQSPIVIAVILRFLYYLRRRRHLFCIIRMRTDMWNRGWLAWAYLSMDFIPRQRENWLNGRIIHS